MKKGIIVNLKNFKLLGYIAKNKLFIALCFIFILGIALGSAMLQHNAWLSNNVEAFFKNFIVLHTQKTFFKKVLFTTARNFVILIVYFLSGASMLGMATTPFVILWQGIFTGSLIAFVYRLYGINGIAFNTVILIPFLSIFTVCCFFAAKHSINFSFNIAKLTLPKSRPISLYCNFKTYCNKYLVIAGVAVICSFIEIILNLLFLKHFKF